MGHEECIDDGYLRFAAYSPWNGEYVGRADPAYHDLECDVPHRGRDDTQDLRDRCTSRYDCQPSRNCRGCFHAPGMACRVPGYGHREAVLQPSDQPLDVGAGQLF